MKIKSILFVKALLIKSVLNNSPNGLDTSIFSTKMNICAVYLVCKSVSDKYICKSNNQ